MRPDTEGRGRFGNPAGIGSRQWWTRVARGLCAACGRVPPRRNRRTCLRCGVAAAARSRATYNRRHRP